MEHVIKDLSSTEQEVTISLTKDELEPHYEKAYRKVQPEIQMGGFRKGKVPLSIVKRHFGKSIRAEAVQDIISESFGAFLHENKVKIIGEPQVHEIDDASGGLKFAVHYEILPDIALNDYKGLVVDEPVHVVSEEEIENYIKTICTQQASFENAEQITDYDFVVGIKLTELDAETGLPLAGKTEDIHVYLADEKIAPGLKESLLNAKVADTASYVHESQNPGASKKYNIEVLDIQKLIPAEFNDELVAEITKGKFGTTEDYRQEIEFKMQEEWDNRSRQALENNLINKIVEMNPDVPVPGSVVEKVAVDYYKDMLRNYDSKAKVDNISALPDELREHILPIAERLVRWELIRSKIIELEGLEVEQYDIEQFVEVEAERYSVDKEKLALQVKGNENVKNSILAKKAIELLLDFAVTNEVKFEQDGE